MTGNFITIRNVRLLKSAIKRFEPRGELKIAIFFKASKMSKVDYEIFTFESTSERDEMIEIMDSVL